ncbi:MAG: exodeoxyribonuclease V subunit gamma [Ruminococcus sp.]|nr:exodeoxyribonuclease V subunit gamma [Ruminococcus sp.]
MVEFITGPAGSGKTTLLLERISAGDPAKQIVLVPEQYSYEFDKTLYSRVGAPRFNEMLSLSFTSLSRHLFQLYGDPDRRSEYADELARMIMIYQAINAVRRSPEQLRYFRRQSEQSGFAEEVLKLISDMKRSGIEPHHLADKAVFFERRLMDKTNDIAAIYDEYERLMTEYGFKDHLDNIREASKVANVQRYFLGKDIYLDSFESFTGDQIGMLSLMIAEAENVYITLCTDNVKAGEFTLFETVNGTYRRLVQICRDCGAPTKITECRESYRFRHPELAYLSSHILRNARLDASNAPAPENIRIHEVRDMYSETEYICAAIKRLIYEDKSLRFRDIAVISNSIDQYSDVLRAAFSRYDIPCFLSVKRSVTHTSIMVFFTSLLDILTARKLHTEQILRMLKCGITDISVTDISLLENYCYKWGIDGDMWRSSFSAPDTDLDKLEQLRADYIVPLLDLKKKLARSQKAEKICEQLYTYLRTCSAEKNVCRIMTDLIRSDRDHDAAELKRLWGCLIDILDSIADTLGEREMSLSEISRMIKSMIGRIEYSVPPQTLDSVIAAPALTARLNAPKVVFVIGVTDGDFPARVSIHGLFSESDKQKLCDNGIELSRPLSDLIAAQRLVVYKSLSAASEKLFLTYSLSDLSGEAKYPSQIVSAVRTMFGSPDIFTTDDSLTPDYYSVTFHSAFYHYMQDSTRRDSIMATLRKLLMSEPEYSRRLAYVYTRSDSSRSYRIDTEVMEKLRSFTPLQLSSTGLEEYDTCHFKFFCDKCMKLRKCEKIDLDPRLAGELTHECFYGILSSRSKSEFINMSYDDLSREIQSRAEKYKETKLAGDFGKSPRFELIFNKLTERLSGIFLHAQQELMATSFTPRAFELNTRESHPVSLSFGNGRSLSFGGVIDRVDTCRINGTDHVRIIDYKSRKKQIDAFNLATGTNLQMLLYLFSVTEPGGLFEGHVPAGVLYSPVQISSVKADDSRTDTLNSKLIDASLKTDGLIIDDLDVLEAMESGVSGNYIPAKLTSTGSLSKGSSCISSEAMSLLKEYTYGKLTEMADSLLSGNADALPLYSKDGLPCDLCDYINICDNLRKERFRTADPEAIAEAERLLGITSEKEDGNGLD